MNTDVVNESPGEDSAQRRATGLQAAGARLRAARCERKLSVEAVAGRLRLAAQVVDALEAGDQQRLPGPAFVRGYVRAYARIVDLPEQPLLDELGEASPTTSAVLGHAGSIRYRPPLPVGKWLLWALLAAVLVLLLVYGIPMVERLLSRGAQPVADGAAQLAIPVPGGETGSNADGSARLALPGQPVTAGGSPERSPQAQQAVEVEPPAKPAPPARAVLRLSFSGDSWVEVTAGDRKLLAGIMHAGSSRTLRGRPPFQVLLGNAPAVEVEYNGKAFDTSPYQRGKVARFQLNN